MQDKIIFCGFVEDNILPIIYNGCNTFVYPSYYEGFGLPPLEAMSCGVPVITSNISSIPEVTSDNALLIDPYDDDDLSDKLACLLNDDNLRLSLSKKGYERSLNFSWNKTALNTLNAYEKIYDLLGK